MKHALPLVAALFLLGGCVDTTGISQSSTKLPRGNPDSSVVVTEYGDFQCPACAVINETVTRPLTKKYANSVSFVFKQFPLLTIHQYSLPLAEASECAADQGKFWGFVDMAYGEQLKMQQANPPRTYQPSDTEAWAKALSLDTNLFDRCVRSGIKQKVVMDDFAEGRGLAVNGTPTFFVDGKQVTENSVDALSAIIDAALKNAPAKAAPKL